MTLVFGTMFVIALAIIVAFWEFIKWGFDRLEAIFTTKIEKEK